MFGFYSHWKVWYKSEKAFGMCSEWHYTTRGLAYGDMTTRPDGLVVMSPSANLPRCVMPFWTHAHAFSLYDITWHFNRRRSFAVTLIECTFWKSNAPKWLIWDRLMRHGTFWCINGAVQNDPLDLPRTKEYGRNHYFTINEQHTNCVNSSLPGATYQWLSARLQ